MEPVHSGMGNFDTDQFRNFHVKDGSMDWSMTEARGV